MSTFKKTMSLVPYLHTITKDIPDDYFLRVKTEKQTLTTKEISAEVAAKNGKYSAEEVNLIMTDTMEVISEAVSSGYIVNTPLCYIQPCASGIVMQSELAQPVDRNRVRTYASFSQGPAMKQAMSQNQLEIFQQPALVGPMLNGVSNPLMPTAGYILAGDLCVISGRNLKLVGDNEAVGITFTNVKDSTTVHIPASRVHPNEPTALQFVLPATVTNGLWLVTVTTQYAGGGTLVHEPRTADFTAPVQVGEEVAEDK